MTTTTEVFACMGVLISGDGQGFGEKINQSKVTASDKGRRCLHGAVREGLSTKVTFEQSPEWIYGEKEAHTLCSMTAQEGVPSEELGKASGKKNFDTPGKLLEKDQSLEGERLVTIMFDGLHVCLDCNVTQTKNPLLPLNFPK